MIEADSGAAPASKPAAQNPCTGRARATSRQRHPQRNRAAATIRKAGHKRPSAGGPVEFRLPEVSEGVTKVDIASVNVKVGDTIASGAVVCEVETDKAVAEINCPHAGTITAVHIRPGTTYQHRLAVDYDQRHVFSSVACIESTPWRLRLLRQRPNLKIRLRGQ